MIILFWTIQCLLMTSFLFHSYIVMTPAIDELGFERLAIHFILMTVSWMLFLLSKEIFNNEKENKNKPDNYISKDDL
jgi:hypothetical protein